MKTYIGNILIKESFGEKYKIFNVVTDINNIDKRFPTLIIGWELANEYFKNLSILDWKINDMFYWTHNRNIKRNRYINDINRFKEFSIKRLIKSIDYESFNLFNFDNSRIKKMLDFFKNEEKKYVYVSKEEIYIYCFKIKKIIGISLIESDYLGISKKEILDFLKYGNSQIVYNDYNIPFEIKDKITNKRYIIPFLTYLFDNE